MQFAIFFLQHGLGQSSTFVTINNENMSTTSTRTISLPLVGDVDDLHSQLNASKSPPRQRLTGFVTALNRFGVVYFGGLTAIMYGTILCLSGQAYPEKKDLIIYGSTYLVINILVNFYLCRCSKPFYTVADSADLPVSSANFCSYCQITQPPRCHHCPICQRCVPKRDHHCFFTGVCVGERNQGHFTVYCLHCGLGLLLGFAVLSAYLSSSYYEVFSWDFYRYFPPLAVFELLFGNIDIITFFSIILLCGGLVSGIFSLILFSWQFLLISCDVTSYELSLWWRKRSYLLRFRPCFNLSQTFGRFWILHFLLPVAIFYKSGSNKYKQYI